jgi:asparagine synthase (glutamine-hydrolysing)
MCGISGFFDNNGINGNLTSFNEMSEIVAHRGPDGYGAAYFDILSEKGALINFAYNRTIYPEVNATLALSHRRLAIIDLSEHGSQPMPSMDSQLWITYNGEIYNYIELRKELSGIGYRFNSESDTEVIVAAYNEWGEECVNHFNGI